MLREPRPADWGIGMTVCIAAICEPEVGDEYIVTASDRMVSMGGYFSGDEIVRKIDPCGVGWTSMLAGNDVSPAVPILAKIMASTRDKPDYGDTQESVADAFRAAYKAQRMEAIEDDLLASAGFTWETFRKSDARAQLPERTYERIIDNISTYELDITFLVSGFDSDGEAHIFTISNPGKCDYYKKLGFWSIGSGQHQAVASMFASRYDRHNSLEECVAQVLASKLSAESASGVGKDTWLMAHSAKLRNTSMFIKPHTVSFFRSEWDKLPRIPSNTLSLILEDIRAEKERIVKEASSSTEEPSAG
jgi:hypothetical protein